jgi:hypothetical protein
MYLRARCWLQELSESLAQAQCRSAAAREEEDAGELRFLEQLLGYSSIGVGRQRIDGATEVRQAPVLDCVMKEGDRAITEHRELAMVAQLLQLDSGSARRYQAEQPDTAHCGVRRGGDGRVSRR